MNFERGKTPAQALDLGGYTFENLREGAIIRCKKWFGVSRSTGELRGYAGSAIRFQRDITYLYVRHLKHNGKKMALHFSVFYQTKNETLEDLKKRIDTEVTTPIYPYYGNGGFIDNLTKTKFDYRMEIIDYI